MIYRSMKKIGKKVLAISAVCFVSSQVMAQHVYQIRADSVRIYNVCDTAELIIENRTQDTLGFLFNKGKGRTEFRKLQLQTVGGNAIAITGQDTITLNNIIKTAVDTIYTAGNILYYRKTNGVVVNVPLDLSAWGDARYDLKSTNTRLVGGGEGTPWTGWASDKVIGYDAYEAADMPALSDQAYQSVGGKNFYDGIIYKTRNSGFDMAFNWNGETWGPNGVFVRTKDDNQTVWSAWRELLFKDYADNKYVRRNATASFQTTGPGWYRIAINGTATSGGTTGSRAHGRFILTDVTSGMHQTVEFIASVLFNTQPTLKLISNASHANYPFAAIRMVRGGTNEGSAVEVLVSRTEALNVKAILIDNEQAAGWTMVNWQKMSTTTGVNDGLPAGLTQTNLTLSAGAIEGSVDQTGSYWQYVRGAGVQTNAGFRHRNYLGLVGDYTTNTTAQKIIWTVGDAFTATNNYWGLGYDYGTQVTTAAQHQIVIAGAGTIYHRFNMGAGVSLTGDLKTTGSTTSTGFYQSSLRSLKKDITLFSGDALKLINELKIMEFTYKDDKAEDRHVGIIADDSDWHFSTKAHDKFDSNSAISITMKAIQELTEKIDALNKRIDALEAK